MKAGKLIMLAFTILLFASCKKDRISGTGSVVTEQRNVTNFTKVHTSGSTDVEVKQGVDFKVEVTGYSNLIPYFETRLNNGTLELGYKNDVHVRNDNIKVLVTLPVLNGLSTSGSGDISTTGNFSGNTNFDCNISGSGNISIAAGASDQFRSTISGSGDVFALGMIATNAEITISGSGDSEITAVNQLKVTIAGSGNVYYLGTPTITAQISGSGSVIPR